MLGHNGGCRRKNSQEWSLCLCYVLFDDETLYGQPYYKGVYRPALRIVADTERYGTFSCVAQN